MEHALTFSVTDEGFRRSDWRVVPWHDIGGFTTYLDTMGGRDALAEQLRLRRCCRLGTVAWRSIA